MMLRIFEMGVGLYYFTFGIDGFVKKIPLPTPSASGLKFLIAIDEAKYILFLVKIVEIMVGVMWVAGWGGGLAWILFTPVWLNILLYHLVLNRKEIVLPIFLILSHSILAYKYWDFLKNVLLSSF